MSKTRITSLRWTVDSIEEGIAALFDEQERRVALPTWMLPPDAGEGDVLAVRVEPAASGESIQLRISLDRAAARDALARSKRQIAEMDRLQRDAGPAASGDIVL